MNVQSEQESVINMFMSNGTRIETRVFLSVGLKFILTLIKVSLNNLPQNPHQVKITTNKAKTSHKI